MLRPLRRGHIIEGETIFTTKYSKEEEIVILTSNVLGFCVGAIVIVLTVYLLNLFSIRSIPLSSAQMSITVLELGSMVSVLGWVTTFGLCLFLLKKRINKQWRGDIRRMIPGTLFLPLGLVYSCVVIACVLFPLCSLLLPYIDPALAALIGLMAFLPFTLLWLVTILPESPGGKKLRKSIHYLRNVEKNEAN